MLRQPLPEMVGPDMQMSGPTDAILAVAATRLLIYMTINWHAVRLSSLASTSAGIVPGAILAKHASPGRSAVGLVLPARKVVHQSGHCWQYPDGVRHSVQ